MKYPCLKVVQPIGEFYLASLNSAFLKKVTYSREADFEKEYIEGNQRRILQNRVNEIKEYISTYNSTIPNTIILSANYTKRDELVVDGDKRWEIIEEAGNFYLEIPDENLEICSIIDGQHRINGFIGSQIEMDLPCSIFIDLPPSLQAFIFATINFNQQKVDKSLAYQLFGYQLDESDSESWSPDILGVKLSRKFNSSGPLKGRIDLIKGHSKNKEDWRISSAAFIEGVVSLISGNSKKDKYIVNKKKIIGYGSRKDLKDNKSYPLRKYYIEGNDRAIMMIFERYFTALNKFFWVNRTKDDIVFRTVGIAAQFSFLKELILNEKIILDSTLDFSAILENIRDIQFDDEYFSARSATKKRLLDVLKLRVDLITSNDLDQQIIDAAKFAK
jgi:DNA phosphorothioation-associated DGQHR protein 1